MVANDPHNRKSPLILGMIALVSGILLALFVISKVKAAVLNPSVYDTDFLIDNNNDFDIIGSDGILYIVDGFFTKSVEDQKDIYDYWWRNVVFDTIDSFGFSNTNYSVVKGEVQGVDVPTSSFFVSERNFIQELNIKEIDFIDELYEVMYFQTSIYHTYAFVQYYNSNNLDHVWGNVDLDIDNHIKNYDAVWTEFYEWNTNTLSWDRAYITGDEVSVNTILKSTSFVKLDHFASVNVKSTRFLLSDPDPTNSPTPSPTSAPSASEEEYFFLNLTDYGYVCFTFKCNDFNKPVEQLLQNNDMLSGIMSNFNTGNIFENGPIFIKRTNSKGGSLYFTGSNVTIGNWYYLGSTIVNYDLEYIKENYAPHSGSPIQLYQYTLYESSGSVVGLNCIYFTYGYSGSGYYTNFVNGGSFNVISLSESVEFPYAFTVNSYRDDRPMYYVYKYGLNSEENVNPNPTPTPTAAPPTPTSPPYVIIITPDPSPSPTPPFVIPTMPPWNPPGNQLIPLDPGIQNDVFGEFNFRLGDNNAFGLFGLLISLLPGDLMWYLWFLLFILLVVGVAKLIIHFTGG